MSWRPALAQSLFCLLGREPRGITITLFRGYPCAHLEHISGNQQLACTVFARNTFCIEIRSEVYRLDPSQSARFLQCFPRCAFARGKKRIDASLGISPLAGTGVDQQKLY